MPHPIGAPNFHHTSSMKPRLHPNSGLCCGALLLSLTACGIPIATLHGPVPTKPTTSTATVGFSPIFLADAGDEDFLMFSLILGAFGNIRHGVSERLEVGGSFGMFNGLTVEAKYNLVPGPLAVSANLAASTGIVPDIDIWGGGDDEAEINFGLHPALLVGGERLYGGAKLLTFPLNTHVRRPWSVVFAGGSFGGRTRIVPEIAWLRDPEDGQTEWIAGIGVQRQQRSRTLR